jgi:hypothetical protein
MRAISENLVDGGFLLSSCVRFKGGVREGVSKGEEDGRRTPALRVGYPLNGRKAVLGGGPPAGRIRVGHGGAG